LIVMKFGGSCLDKTRDIRRMVDIIKSASSLQPKAVLSAFKGTTDELLGEAISAKNGKFDINRIEARHHELSNDLSSGPRTQIEPQVNKLLRELRNTLTGVSYLRELTPPVLDRILAYGEELAIHISAGYLAEDKLKGVPLAGIEAGILTNSNFGNATILDESYDLVRERLGDVHIPLIAGFFGTDKAGRLATLGRGATDYVATFVAAAFGCKTILFKDVDGVLTADPKIVPNARLISNLDYETAIELSRYGSKVLFEKAVVPAMKAKLPIEVKGFEKEGEGTLVSSEGRGGATSCLKGMSMVQVSGIQSFNLASSILSRLAEALAGGPMAVAPVFRDGMYIIADEDRSTKVSEIVGNIGRDIKVEVRKGLSLVSLIGKRFSLSQVSDALRKASIEPIAILTAPSGITKCSIVGETDTDTSIRALHEELFAN
jgi:aspartate kinase